jgi:hypothetical protein
MESDEGRLPRSGVKGERRWPDWWVQGGGAAELQMAISKGFFNFS